MGIIDTHSHLFAEEFDEDREQVIQRAKEAGVEKIILPNIDKNTLGRMLDMEEKYPNYCYSAVGLHPEGVNENYEQDLLFVKKELQRRKYIAVGEIGIDLYWDKTFRKEQIKAFQTQIEWALEYDLPIIVHLRESFDEIFSVLQLFKGKGLRGVVHSFTGTVEQAQKIIDLGGFKIGINGIVTFKNSGLDKVVKEIPIENILIETDSPYLTPTPFRGKRNESAYVALVRDKLAEIYSLSTQKVNEITTKSAQELFDF